MTAPLSTQGLTGAPYWKQILSLLRVRQWVKNVFVLPAPLFGGALHSIEAAMAVTGAFFAFCFLSSAVYIFNDFIDREADRHHVTKRLRPLASGTVSPEAAIALLAILLVLGNGIAWLAAGQVALLGLLYLANNAAYTLFLKRLVLADVFSIALGFMLRIFAGAAAVNVEPSSWLLVCGFSIALFLGFCKRRSELGRFYEEQRANGADPTAPEKNAALARARAVLASYSEDKLNLLMTATATITILSYMLFTVSPETIERHGTPHLIYTSPFVVYGVLRFLLATLDLAGEDATDAIYGDPGLLVAGCGWLVTVIWVLGI